MTATTLHGTIPGLLRQTSPIIVTRGQHVDRRGVVIEVDPDGSHAVVGLQATREDDASVEWLPIDTLALDLRVATGLIHAVWWMAALDERRLPAAVSALNLALPPFGATLEQAIMGSALSEGEIRMIRRVGLRLAGVSDAT